MDYSWGNMSFTCVLVSRALRFYLPLSLTFSLSLLCTWNKEAVNPSVNKLKLVKKYLMCTFHHSKAATFTVNCYRGTFARVMRVKLINFDCSHLRKREAGEKESMGMKWNGIEEEEEEEEAPSFIDLWRRAAFAGEKRKREREAANEWKKREERIAE